MESELQSIIDMRFVIEQMLKKNEEYEELRSAFRTRIQEAEATFSTALV
jgi:hypothetical protein